ncbi:hypothetical protein MHC_00595 [Mycoplasma haemocanis str. Illinois]|uniref:Rod shape-determining protein MreD n=1 Tax=Mycoplasma haemocanis (strain Illinois) TaxID=1111676 RepID=H6N5M5_MYCHN|nr:hypothetical protein [Mycoplasma haemocanis]AEW44985.1 hypothetical protein MHC_00595 [Mycoplasma haemocanis str. Illinois]
MLGIRSDSLLDSELRKYLYFVFSALVFSKLQLFLPYIGIKISALSVPLVMVGWIFGPMMGFATGVLVDLISLSDYHTFSPLFLLQTAAIGYLGGIVRRLPDSFSLLPLNLIYFLVSLFFAQDLIPVVLFHILMTTYLASRDPHWAKAAIILTLIALLLSFLYGSFSAHSYFSHGTLDFFLRARIFKESLKISFLTPILGYLLSNYGK